MRTSDFDFHLPEELIASFPLEDRSSSRLLVVHRRNKTIEHRKFCELVQFLNEKDLIVLNNSKVIPARLFGRSKHGGSIEVLLLDPLESSGRWRCLVKPGRKVRGELEICFQDGSVALIHRINEEFEITFPECEETVFFDWLEKVGVTPLPPYIKRKTGTSDFQTYQTVFAKKSGSVAAPTAGLHFTEGFLERIREKGIQIAEVTLHVGYGTFAPIQTEEIQDHKMHFESFSTDPELQEKIKRVRAGGGRVVAIGTTSLRTLESLPIFGERGRTNLFIKPGYEFKNIDLLVTNFHTPKSSLFVLVSALLGTEWAKEIYRVAVAEKYRFFSYGDAMLID